MKFPEQFRWQPPIEIYRTNINDPFGMFWIGGSYAKGRGLKVMACDGTETGWEHVSVSLMDSPKCPSWEEMCIVKALFWDDDETVIQFHPPKSEYVNKHPGCLHLWKQSNLAFPLPPSELVGPK